MVAPNSAFMYDNAPAHRRANGPNGPQILPLQDLRPLPPYSPMLNIVENAISVFKAALKRDLVRKRPRLFQMTHEQRMARLRHLAVAVGVPAIQPHMGANFFGTCIPTYRPVLLRRIFLCRCQFPKFVTIFVNKMHLNWK